MNRAPASFLGVAVHGAEAFIQGIHEAENGGSWPFRAWVDRRGVVSLDVRSPHGGFRRALLAFPPSGARGDTYFPRRPRPGVVRTIQALREIAAGHLDRRPRA